ncbi:glycosyltransferase family 2 protein [Tardiphaga sp. vice278]|uniref:glycosyltransferase family 2 protein n=1 Tax=Tardiphaga sp. vice278 TaxID=2592815 RepID=UPI001162A97B|nr:glycosyltransferase family 2 protein [Tardiphaga sp. vice278]QDM17948.1 glycosyltransferase family 2 protein [Tardiphaga sp. vice278]
MNPGDLGAERSMNSAGILALGEPAPKVSIIILNWNKSELTLDCVRRVAEHAGDVTQEVIVVDNGSDPLQLGPLRDGLDPAVWLVCLNENLFFGEANNIGAEAAAGEYILLLNNDVQVTAGYLEPLLRAFSNQFSVGAVGSKFLFLDDSLQEAGCFVLPDGFTFQHGKHGMEIAKRFEIGCHIVDYCSAACLLLRRAVFLDLGGFDPLFDPAYFEDVDLSFRLRSKGLYTYYCSESAVYHLENQTSLAVWSRPELTAVAVGNHGKFFERWKDYLARRLSEDIEPPPLEDLAAFRAEVSGATTASIMLCTAGKMEISDECREMLEMAASFQSDCEVIFAVREICSEARIHSLCRHYAIRLGKTSVRRFSPEELDNASPVHAVLFGPLANQISCSGSIHSDAEPDLVATLQRAVSTRSA